MDYFFEWKNIKIFWERMRKKIGFGEGFKLRYQQNTSFELD